MTIDEFSKVDLRVGRVLQVERVEGSDKLLKLSVDVGETGEDGVPTPRQILAGVGKAFEPEVLIQKNIVVVVNLDPRALMGLTSNGMLLAATDVEGKPAPLGVLGDIPPGSRIR